VSYLKYLLLHISFVACALILLAAQADATGQRENSRTFAKIYSAIEAIRVNCHVPTGLEMGARDPGSTPIALDVDCQDVARNFDRIVMQRPAYKWSLEDGVYDLYPKAIKDQLSGLNIKTFVLQDSTRIQALVALDKSPEVQNWRSRHRQYGGVIISQTGFPQTQRRVSVAFENTSLRKILNWLSMNVGSNPQESQWSLVPYGQKSRHLNISF
jgi:hypothetical protein